MRSDVFHVSGVAVSAYAWLPVNSESRVISYHILKTGTGDITYSLQGTLSNLEEGGLNVSTVSAKAFDIVSGKTGTFLSSFAFPVMAIRLNATAVSGAGNLDLITLQTPN